MFRGCGEIMFDGQVAYAVLRPGVGPKEIVRIHPDLDRIEKVGRGDYLQVRDSYIQGHGESAKRGLVLDFSPFFRDFPKINDPAEMGEGITFLSRHLSAQLEQHPAVFRRRFLGFLRDRSSAGAPILVNRTMDSPERLLEELGTVRSLWDDISPETPYAGVADVLSAHCLEAGWGRTVGDSAANLALLSKVMNSSDSPRLEGLLERLPLIRTVLMISPHGWFAQEGVLGRPDTGGQVTYVLDQARAIEKHIREQLEASGLDEAPRIVILTRLIPEAEGTTCNVRREKVLGSENTWIVRVPFRDATGEVVPQWISRFHIWPYLEQFAEDSRGVIADELLEKPDLIVAHYTDGNLVAHRLAEDCGCTHGACVHALEKTKYLFSDLRWAEMEPDYNFSVHFTADLIAYNSADFIVSISYREVGGTTTQMGMIESYELFSMHGLYRVQSGFDPRLARHNIVPPGASEEHFFPSHEHERRVPGVAEAITSRYLGGEPGEGSIGVLSDPTRPLIFAMARNRSTRPAAILSIRQHSSPTTFGLCRSL